MRMDKLTSRFQQALADAQSLAVGRDHPAIEPVHLLQALLDQDSGSTLPLLQQAGVNADMLRLITNANRAGWVQSTFITPDTEILSAQANEQMVNAVTKYAKDSRRFDKVPLPAIERRQFDVLKNSLTVSAPPDPKEAEELTRILASMEGAYGSGKYCPKGASASECSMWPSVTPLAYQDCE